MLGYLVRHRQLGLGKVIGAQNRTLTIKFVDSGQVLSFSPQLFANDTLSREELPIGTQCRTTEAVFTVAGTAQRPLRGDPRPFLYAVVRDTQGSIVVSEVELLPIRGAKVSDPLLLLAGQQTQPYELYRTRENFAAGYARLLQHGSGLRALLASRVDLRPHQAYVAGTVILDLRRRYILADEVGLGKTIEAGIVIHDLLAQKPEARVLVLCPSALTQQWLAELYGKFSGRLFTLLDLHQPALIPWQKLRLAISSTYLASYQLARQLEQFPWDMVVVDEAHHLLTSQVQHDFVEKLSRRCPSVLLLSAIPAHEREDELLRLLALLEPERYSGSATEARERFATLHSVQPQIGRGLRVLSRRVEGLASGEFTFGDAADVARRLVALPVLKEDEELQTRAEALADQANPTDELRRLIHDIADRYRLSRRILRNRRQRLVAQEQIACIVRRAKLHTFDPDQFELELLDAISSLLAKINEQCPSAVVAAAIARVLLQGTVIPETAFATLTELSRTAGGAINDRGYDFIAMGHTIGTTDWSLYRQVLFRAVMHHVTARDVEDAVARAAAWRRSTDASERWTTLLRFLREAKDATEQPPKLLLFAGFPGAAETIADALRQEFADGAVVEFRGEMAMEEKERGVLRFQRDPATWLLVSDETGGEGRNFQFASELVHIDTPWFAAQVEQRIGRLDRLGREKYRMDVISNVLVNGMSAEAGLVRCYEHGLGIYTQSISGLEFALREVERTMIGKAIIGGRDSLAAYADEIVSVVRTERANDDSEVVLDEASFERSAAIRYRAVSHSEQLDRGIEQATTAYMKALSGGHGARDLQDGAGAGTVWRLRPEESRFGALPVGPRGEQALTGDIDGTFRRDIAQERPSLRFFTIGESLFDALVRSLELQTTGRVYAVELVDPQLASWMGFEFAFAVGPDARSPEGNYGLANRSAGVFPPRPIRLYVSLDGELSPEPDKLTSARRSLDQRDRGRRWWDLHEHASRILPHVTGGADWQHTLERAHGLARTTAESQFADRLHEPLEQEMIRLFELEREVQQRIALSPHDSEIQMELRNVRLLRESMANWRVRLDAVGFLSVNGRVRELAND